MSVIAGLVVLVLLALSSLHLVWSLGSSWPARSEFELARAVAGFRGIEKMPPPAASAFVALALAGIALAASLLASNSAPDFLRWPVWLGSLAASAVFLGRGAAGFTPSWRRLTPEAPFARLDRMYYSPLCLALGLCRDFRDEESN